jgi:hypothetical protein
MNKPLRASTSQVHAAHSVLRDAQVHTLLPNTSQQHHAAGYHQPSMQRSFQSPEHYRHVRVASTIEEEDVQMVEQLMYASDSNSYDGQHAGYYREDDTYDGQDLYSDGDFDDSYGGKQSLQGAVDEYDEEYTPKQSGTKFHHCN